MEQMDLSRLNRDALLYAMGSAASKLYNQWDNSFEPTKLSSNKVDAKMEHVKGEKATLGMGPPTKPCATFGVMQGVIRCKVGFAGGTTKKRPTFRKPGDYTLAIQIEFDSDKTQFKEVLDVFWNEHDYIDPFTLPGMQSVIFYHDQNQKAIAETYKHAKEEEHERVATKIVQFTTWIDAKPKHQHEILQKNSRVWKLLKRHLKRSQMAHSHLAARLEGYLEGHGTRTQFEEEVSGLFISMKLADLIRQYTRADPDHHIIDIFNPQDHHHHPQWSPPRMDKATQPTVIHQHHHNPLKDAASQFPLSYDHATSDYEYPIQSPNHYDNQPHHYHDIHDHHYHDTHDHHYHDIHDHHYPDTHDHHYPDDIHHHPSPIGRRLSRTIPYHSPSAPLSHPPHSHDWRDAHYDRSFYPPPPTTTSRRWSSLHTSPQEDYQPWPWPHQPPPHLECRPYRPRKINCTPEVIYEDERRTPTNDFKISLAFSKNTKS